MNKSLLLALCVTLISLFSVNARAQGTAPSFTMGDTATLTVCQNGAATSINSLLAVMDADTAETATWATVVAPANGTVVAAYTTATTGGTLTPTGLTYMPTAGYSGTDMFSVEVSDGTFMDTIIVMVTITALPSAGTISAASTVCVSASISVSGSVSGGSWSLTNGHASLTGSTITGVSAGIDTLLYVVTNSCGADTARRAFTVNPLPSAGTISGPSTVCVGSAITLTSSATGGSWSSANATANITSAGLVTGLTGGIDTITYFVVNSCGVDYTTAIITVTPLPYAGTISSPAAVCVGASVSVSGSVSGGSWGLSNTNASLTGSTLTGVTAGIDTIIYIFTNACGSDTAMRAITVSPVAVAGTISGPSLVCEGATITDTASVTGGTWSVTNTNASVSGGIVTGLAGGTDTVLYIVSNACNADTARHAITINPLPAVGSLSGASSLCIGDSITITATVTGGTWTASNAHATVTDSVVRGITAGIDTIIYSTTNACGTSTATHIVTVNGAPHAGPITGPDRVCLGSTITLTAPSSSAWSERSGTTSITSGGVVTGVTFGRDTIMNIATGACGTDTAYHFVRVDTAAPHASIITGPFIVCVNDTIRVADSVTGGVWAMSNSHANINTTGRIRGVSAGLDTVIYRLANGCGADTVYYPITINPLPNAGTITGYDSVCAGNHITLVDATIGGIWVSDNAVFADVDTAGVVSGYLHGSANIYYIVSNSCGSDSAAKHVNINIPALPIIGGATLCQGATSILLDPLPGGAWSTTLAGYFVVGPLIAGSVIGITVGTATVTYTVRNACGTTTATFDVTVVVCDSSAAVTETGNGNTSIGVYPNPGKGLFTVTLPFSTNDMADVMITNMLGEQVSTMKLQGNKTNETNINLPAGVYMLSASLNNERYTTRIVITE